MMKKLVRCGKRSGCVTAPPSKSQAHRLLICATLSQKVSFLRLNSLSDDIRATVGCLNALGASISEIDGGLRVEPIRKAPTGECVLPCGESGSTLRFLLPVAGALGIDAVFHMEGRLPMRPMDALTDELKRHGLRIEKEIDTLRCSGQLQSGDYALPGNVSSQFVSGLLFALPLADGDSRLFIRGALESAAYVDMTAQALQGACIQIENLQNGYCVSGNQTYQSPMEAAVEGDWSNAAFFLGMGALSANGVTVRGLDGASAQGDRAILDLLRGFGADVRLSRDGVTVRGGALHPQTIDARLIPDLVPALGVMACGAVGQSRVVHAERLRLKESDRLRTTCKMISALGGEAAQTEDGLVVNGSGRLRGGCVDSGNDHRIAMAAALAASLCGEDVQIDGAQCVNKSYPDFFEDLETLSIES